jgi:predicted nuclease with TOPRIM domain
MYGDRLIKIENKYNLLIPQLDKSNKQNSNNNISEELNLYNQKINNINDKFDEMESKLKTIIN